MKNPQKIIWGLVIATGVVGAVVFLTPPSEKEKPPAASPPAVETAQTPAPPSAKASVIAASPAAPVVASKGFVDLPETAPDATNAVRVRTGRALAQVNGTSIELKHLVPLEPGETEKAMTPEEYQSRLNRAIEMELTFQAAAARKLELTAEQRKRIDGITQKHEAALEEYKKQGITWSSTTAAQLEFEKRLTSALLLQQNLVAKESAAAPSPDAAAQARYERALRDILDRLKARGNVTISTAAL